jgi:hypothetical protein
MEHIIAKLLTRRPREHMKSGLQVRPRFLALSGAVALVIAVVSPATVRVAGQAPSSARTTAAAKTETAFRTPWGAPDLQGTWDNSTITPLERPKQFEGKEFLTREEAAKHEAEVGRGEVTPVGHVTHRLDAPGAGGAVGIYNDFWMDQGSKVVGSRRTSLIVDPPDGKIPPLTPEAKKRSDARVEARRKRGPADSWEDVSLQNRCLVWAAGIPHLPSFYNNYYQIVQTPEQVAIVSEMIHNVRIIPLDGRPHIGENIRQWLGDSRGRWEGNTLVVDTTNFTDKTLKFGASENMRLVERFTRVDADTIKYEFTVNDPATFTRPWSAEVPMLKTRGRIYEYSCHEGNYALEGILAGARADEKAAAEAAKKGSR